MIDKAKVPKSPVSPNKKLNFILALLISVVGGGSLCFVLEYLDNTIKRPEEIEELSGLPSISHLRSCKTLPRARIRMSKPQTPFAVAPFDHAVDMTQGRQYGRAKTEIPLSEP